MRSGIFVTAWGEIKLPRNFPIHLFRKDGSWDGRFKSQAADRAKAFIEDETQKLKTAYLGGRTNGCE